MITDTRYFPEVVQASAAADFHVIAYFSDGSVREIDVRPLLAGEAFAPLRDPETFKKTLTIINRTVAWDIRGNRSPADCIDLDPMVIHRS